MRDERLVDQLLLTRFNLPWQGLERMVHAEERRLENRIQLFEKYCQISVGVQSVENLHRITKFHQNSHAFQVY